MFSETVANSLTGCKPTPPPQKKEPPSKDSNAAKPGVITIVDVQAVGTGKVGSYNVVHMYMLFFVVKIYNI